MRRVVKLGIAVLVLAGVTFLFGFPVRTLLQQQKQMAANQHRSSVLGTENAKLTQRAAQLQTNAEIEQIARSQYGLVKPGEHSYVVLPPTASGSAP